MTDQAQPAPRPAKTTSPVPEEPSSPVAEEVVAEEVVADALPAVAHEAHSPFPIVGIGTSAGGLEALELFLANVPAQSGMAFVIVQHLDPERKSLLVELLQRCTPMPVVQAKDRTRVQPDCVYVIPPNKDLSILHGALHLLDPVTPRGLHLPIDFFLRALAEDQQEQSIGVILSGMGSDGTLGLRAIKEKGGVVFVQEPASAKFDSMPRSAIDAGLADVIAPVEDLPGKINAYLQYTPLITKPGLPDEYIAQSGLEKVLLLLRSQTGHDFSLYKKTTVYRRIERRMGLHQIIKIADYVRYLQEDAPELELLFRDLLIGVTSFFRDPEAWKQLKSEVLPTLLSGLTSDRTLRAWIPACATGEEAYSLAILFQEALEEIKPAHHITLQIFATDLDQQSIEKARQGLFPANITADVSAQRLDRFFVQVENGYQVAKSIREMIIFAPQNIIMDAPFTRLDLLFCRNLLIYLAPELQKKLMPLFHYSLNPGGFLFLGSAETIGSFTDLFVPLDGKTRLYRRLEFVALPVEFPVSVVPSQPGVHARTPKVADDVQGLADQLLLQHYAPAAVLTNDKGDIFYINGRTGKYLEPAPGKANWNIFVMAREGLRHELRAAFQKALRQKETLKLEKLSVGSNGGQQVVDISVQPLSAPKALQGMVLVVFHDVAVLPPIKKIARSRGAGSVRVAELEQELEEVRQQMQSLREEAQFSREEREAANEEMQSMNEELQSTNEELTTSKEELQSMNEELHTVNQELQTRLDELSHTNNDMKNLLDSTDIATLFLDNTLHVRRFTSETSQITRLIPSDVGRPITDIASALLYPQLADDAREVLRTLVKVERQIPISDGNWFAARVLPYRTLENIINGVVITFVDITVSKKLEAKLEAKLSEKKSD
jgi:two-component system CheB/CheR fusion protein